MSIKNKGSLYLEIGATIATIALLIWLGLEARLEWLIISIFVILAICISVYQFPEPQIAPEAKYGAVLVNTRTLECQYYTLEMSDNGLWFYCG